MFHYVITGIGLMILPFLGYAFVYLRRFFALNRTLRREYPWLLLAIALIPILFWAGLILARPADLALLTLFYFVPLLALTDLTEFIILKIRRKSVLSYSKRFRVCLWLVPAILTAGILCYGFVNAQIFRITRYTIETTKPLPNGELKIALISDTHMGTVVNSKRLRAICETIAAEKPDLLVLAGDIYDERSRLHDLYSSSEIFASVPTKYGAYYVFGNHDSDRICKKREVHMKEVRNVLRDAGIVVLEDEGIALTDGISILGRIDSAHQERPQAWTIPEILANTPDAPFKIVIDHRPKDFLEAKKSGIDLLLCGHTHGGQIFPVRVVDEICNLNDWNYGLYRSGDFQAIVSSGLGSWRIATRIGSNAEVVILRVVQTTPRTTD